MSDDIPFADSPILVYAIPFAGSLLIAIGIAAGVVGAYAPVQDQLGLCGSPTISVSTPEATDDLLADEDRRTLSFDRLSFDQLSAAERAAFKEALSGQFREAEVHGPFPHRDAFEGGVLVEYRGTTRYATLVSPDQCVSVNPLLFPIGVGLILLGVVWILAPPMYRRLAAIEREG